MASANRAAAPVETPDIDGSPALEGGAGGLFFS